MQDDKLGCYIMPESVSITNVVNFEPWPNLNQKRLSRIHLQNGEA